MKLEQIRQTAPMPHACRVFHGGQLETMRACGLSDHLIKIFTCPYERRIGGRQGLLVGREWMPWMRSGGGDVLSLFVYGRSTEDVTVRTKACARIR